ncbi:MAG: FecR domain-containing protein [Thermodesulfobacteriota bacterium]
MADQKNSQACFLLTGFFTVLSLALMILSAATIPGFAAVPRQQPAVGVIASASGDAQICLVRESQWIQADSDQDLLTGDSLRTGPLGAMALLFADRTQIRVHRNSSLTVKAVAGEVHPGGSIFRLNQGGAWSRAARDDSRVSIETPSATAAIRGTDWSLQVDEAGRTTLVVLDGTVSLENEFGRVAVSRGEMAVAEIGKAPSKMIMVAPDDRELIYYNMSLAQALGLIPLNDLKTRDRRQAKAELEAVEGEKRTPVQWLDLAELACEDHESDRVRQCLAAARVENDARLSARANLIRGLLAIADLELDRADELLGAAQDKLDPSRRLAAMIGRAGVLLLTRDVDPAKALIKQMTAEYGAEPRFLEFQVVLTAFAGDLPLAADMARQYSVQFPDEAGFPGMEGALDLLLGREEAAEKAAARTLAIDPEAAFGFFVLGTCQSDFRMDKETAIRTFRQGLGFNPSDPDLWGALGLTYYEIDEMQLAEEALLKAISIAPRDMVFLCNYAMLLLDQNRMGEAADTLQQLVAIEPSREITMILQGRQDLQTGRIATARDDFLKATTVNPGMPTGSLGLAIAYYQNGEQALAEQALANAARLDPNDPDIPLVGATMALDQDRSDDAIAYARQAIEKYRRVEGVGVSGLAANRGGKNTLGGAFMDLSLNNWADYYNEVSFDPYSADSHFYRALQFDDYSSLYQGLMLEPLAVSARNRQTDFYRRPFTDFSLGGTVSRPDEGTGYSLAGDIQGFDQSRLPMSYYFSFEAAAFPGDVENAETRPAYGLGMAGMNLTPHDHVIVNISGSDSETGLPGTRSVPDRDDDMEADGAVGAIGYSHSFGARNVFMSLVTATRAQKTIRNDDPFGTGLSAIDYSLVSNFGPDASRLLYAAGLTDVTDPENPGTPLLLVGESESSLTSTIPDVLDTKSASLTEIDNNFLGVSCQHLFTVDEVDFSYGLDMASDRTENRARWLEFFQRDPGVGYIFGADQSLPFVFGDPLPQKQTTRQHGLDGNGHVNALWRIDKSFWVEGGNFFYRYDDDAGTRFTRMGPRAGIAWQVDDRDWLRLMARRDFALPGLASLAPTATVGLFNDMTRVGEGGRSTFYQARWDREWFSHLFTALRLGCQDIHRFDVSAAENSFETYAVDDGRINSLGLAVNLWVRGGIGIITDGVVRDTANRSSGVAGRPELPLVPERELKAGLAWVHPSRIRASLTAGFIGERPVVAGTADLDDYVTTDLALSWQPLDRHLDIGLSVTNLLDANFDQATDMPGPGRVVTVSGKVLF